VSLVVLHWCYCIVGRTWAKCLNELFMSRCTACTSMTVEACKDKISTREKMNFWLLLLWQLQPPCWHVEVIEMYSSYMCVCNMLILIKWGLLRTKGIVVRILNSRPWGICYRMELWWWPSSNKCSSDFPWPYSSELVHKPTINLYIHSLMPFTWNFN